MSPSVSCVSTKMNSLADGHGNYSKTSVTMRRWGGTWPSWTSRLGYRFNDVYQIITDPATARERALDLIESGDLTQLALVLTVAPATAEGITGAFIYMITALDDGNYDTARQIAEQIAQHGNPSQREALAIRLRAFATHQPDQTPALEIADMITPATGSVT
jgi:hypothetical protein